MGLYGFKQQFIPKIESGEKTHTIRGKRKHLDKPGNTMFLYYALRTKQCRLIAKRTCTKVQEIEIFLRDPKNRMSETVVIDGIELSADEREHLAVRDGFSNWNEMLDFWLTNNSLPFAGHMYHWSAR